MKSDFSRGSRHSAALIAVVVVTLTESAFALESDPELTAGTEHVEGVHHEDPARFLNEDSAPIALVTSASAESAPEGQRQSRLRVPSNLGQRAQGDAVYQRPFVLRSRSAALGGYVEGQGTWTREEGIDAGTNFSLKRFNLFVYSQVLPRVQFMAELEFEDGGQEIKIETAQVDVEVLPWLKLRAGALLIPLGQFNQDHDSPRWPFVQRPLVSETIIPATLSEVGFGILVDHHTRSVGFDLQAYVTNGLGDGIVDTPSGRVDIAAGKHDAILHLDNNGRPAFSGRAGVLWEASKGATVGGGLSFYHSVYNVFRMDGESVDERRSLTIGAIDVAAVVGRFELRGEAALARIQLPNGLQGLYGGKQFGWHLDAYTTLFTHPLRAAAEGRLKLVLRVENADYYVGRLDNGDLAGLEIWGVSAGLAWEVGAHLNVRAGVQQRWERDVFNNPPTRSVQAQIGIASYF